MTHRLLVHTRTTGYRHDSIPAALAAVGRFAGFTVDATEDPAALEGDLSRYAAVVFLSTSGDILTEASRAGLAAAVESGTGFAGVHAAACTEEGWPWYTGSLQRSRFAGHPPYGPGRVLVEDRAHPATAHLPAEWDWSDEWYDFDPCPDPAEVHVLLRGGQDRHPLAWHHRQGRGRVFWTALGHADGAYSDPGFLAHLRGGLEWVCEGRG
ncbi:MULTISPECIES: ThuA domain-containing protein [Streptomyces]|uniref:ThuA domain-containing protein n=1 Tax=Streptomyces chilikensis TaxID=1194079 RepID=A0ABV3ESN7_9ACTN|nr:MULTISPECIES: ThuA domain-containing protein [Streptomyces]MDH6224025.1 type 1 glutamine amidotransferase [Streptomyces sp. MJP52]